MSLLHFYFFLFFFNDTATTEIYTLSLHDALPICGQNNNRDPGARGGQMSEEVEAIHPGHPQRSEEHTSELQSLAYLVCRLLLEKKKKIKTKLENSTHIATSERQLCNTSPGLLYVS